MDDNEQAVDDSSDDTSTAKVSPEYQEQCDSIIEGATMPELDYIISMVTDLKKKMSKSQDKSKLGADSFSTDGMPES